MAQKYSVTIGDGQTFESYAYPNQLEVKTNGRSPATWEIAELYVESWERFLPVAVVKLQNRKLNRIPVPRSLKVA